MRVALGERAVALSMVTFDVEKQSILDSFLSSVEVGSLFTVACISLYFFYVAPYRISWRFFVKTFLSVFVTLVSLSVQAQESGILMKTCVAGDKRAEVRMDQVGADVSVKVQTVQRPYGPKRGAGAYTILGQEGTTYTVKDTALAALVADKNILENLISSGLFDMRSFDGDYDVVDSYVDKYISSLQCH